MNGNEHGIQGFESPNSDIILNLMQLISPTTGGMLGAFLFVDISELLFDSHFKEEVISQEHDTAVCHCHRNIAQCLYQQKTCLRQICLYFPVLHIQHLPTQSVGDF